MEVVDVVVTLVVVLENSGDTQAVDMQPMLDQHVVVDLDSPPRPSAPCQLTPDESASAALPALPLTPDKRLEDDVTGYSIHSC